VGRSIPITPPPRFTLRFLFGVLAAFAAFLLFLYARSAGRLDPQQANRQLLGALAAIAVAAAFVALIVWAVNRRSLVVSESELTIKAGFYGRKVNRASLRIELAKTASLFEDRSIAPRWRTNGIRVPGFQAGWFRLVNGEKALVLLTDPREVTYVPTIEGFSLLISTAELLPALNDSAIAKG
jgi:hypothetical protein